MNQKVFSRAACGESFMLLITIIGIIILEKYFLGKGTISGKMQNVSALLFHLVFSHFVHLILYNRSWGMLKENFNLIDIIHTSNLWRILSIKLLSCGFPKTCFNFGIPEVLVQ